MSTDTFERYHDAAWREIEAGRRPTADHLVEQLAGSKQTAVAALRIFWSTELPRRLKERVISAPTRVHALASQVWTEATELATREAQAALTEERAALKQDQEALKSARATFDQRFVDQATTIARLTQAETDLSRRCNESDRALAKATADLETANATNAKLQQSVLDGKDREHALRTQLQAQVVRTDALAVQVKDAQTIHTALEQQLADLRVALDQGERELNQAHAALVEAGTVHAEQLAELQAALAAQHTRALDAIKTAHQSATEGLLLKLDEERTAAKLARDGARESERTLKQRIARLETQLTEATGTIAALAVSGGAAPAKKRTAIKG